MKKPITIKIFPELYNEALHMLRENKQKYRSFTAIMETALAEWIEKEKRLNQANKDDKE